MPGLILVLGFIEAEQLVDVRVEVALLPPGVWEGTLQTSPCLPTLHYQDGKIYQREKKAKINIIGL